MTDLHAPYDEEDRLPWLEPVEEAEEPEGPSTAKLIVAVILGLILIGAAVGGYFWFTGGATGGKGELIAAPEGDYKVKPDDPGGMEVEGEGDTAFAASEGAEPRARIDFSAVPETPVVAEPKAKQPAQAPKQAEAQPAAPAEPAPGGGTIQLGAFSSQAAAGSAWKALADRFGYLEPLSHSIVPVESGGRTLYRLRANGPGADNICGRLRVAGESCVSVN